MKQTGGRGPRSTSLPPTRTPNHIVPSSPRNGGSPPARSPLADSSSSPGGVDGLGSLIGRTNKVEAPPRPAANPGSGRSGGSAISSPRDGSTKIAPSSPRPTEDGGAGAETDSTATIPTTKKSKRASVSLHTDRKNVAAVVDLPINEEIVKQRDVDTSNTPTTPGRGSAGRGPLPAPGSLSQPPSGQAGSIKAPARPSGRGSGISAPSSNTATTPRGPLPAPGSMSQPPPYTPPPLNLAATQKGGSPPTSPKEHMHPPPPPSPRDDDFGPDDEEEDFVPVPVAPAPAVPMDPEKRERLRQEALKEIVNTERDYVKDLELVTEVFLRPLSNQPKIISALDLNNLFSNWELLEGVNKEILRSFDKDPRNVLVGATFLSVMQYLKMYKVYCANQPLALKTLETQQEDNQAFASFLQNCMGNPKMKGQNLFSYLIKPIQRLCKYPLLIKVLLEHTDPSHPDYQNLSQALVEVEEIVEYVNEGKRKAEKSQKILDLALSIDGGDALCLVTPTRTLEMEQNIEVILKKGKPQPRKCVLFNDAILLLKEGRKGNKLYNTPTMMGLGEIRVVNVSDCAEYRNGIELQQLQSRDDKHVLLFESSKDKARWMKSIKAIVKQFQRRQFEEMQKADLVQPGTPPVSASPPTPAGGNVDKKSARKYPSNYDKKEKEPEVEVKVVKNPLLQRRRSFHGAKTSPQQSVIKPPASPSSSPAAATTPPAASPSPTPPAVRYSSKPVIKI